MKLSATNKQDFLGTVNLSVSAETSIVRRYLDSVRFEEDEGRDREFKALVKGGICVVEVFDLVDDVKSM